MYAARVRSYRAALQSQNDPNSQEGATQLSKFVYQRGFASLWYVPGDLHPKDHDLFSPATVDWLRRLVSPIPGLSPAEELAKPLKQKRGTNKGDPTWESDDFVHVVHILMGATPSLDELDRRFVRAREALGVTGLGDQPVLTLLSRTGYTRKAEPIGGFMFPADGSAPLHEFGRLKGVLPRRRHVLGFPNAYNQFIWAPTAATERRLKTDRRFAHSSGDELLAKVVAMSRMVGGRSGARVLSDDASSFDLSISHALYAQVADHVLPRDLFTSDQIEAVKRSNRYPFLVPPLDGRYRAFLASRRGTVASGERQTTLMDTLINAGIVNECVAAAHHLSPLGNLRDLGRTWDFLVQGDDTCLVLANSVPFDVDRYMARAAELGFVRTPSESSKFLMTWLDATPGREAWWGLSTRALMGTLTHERPPAGPHAALFGVWARWERCLADPLYPSSWNVMADNQLFRTFNVSDYGSIVRFVTSPRFLAAFEDEVGGAGSTQWNALVDELRIARVATGGSEAWDYLANKLGGLRAVEAHEATPDELVKQSGLTSFENALAALVRRRKEADATGAGFTHRGDRYASLDSAPAAAPEPL